MTTEKYRTNQLWVAVAGPMIAKVFHTSPRALVLATSTAAPWMALVTATLAFLLFWPVARALSKRPGGTLITLALEAGGRAAGRPLAIGVALFLCAYIIGTCGISLRQVSEMAVTAIYPNTPQTWIMVSLLLAAAIGAAISPAGLVWMCSLLLGPAILAITMVLIGNLGWSTFANLLPATGPGLLPLGVRVLPLTSYFGELVFISAFCAYLETPRRLVAATAWVLGLTAAVWSAVMLSFLLTFPVPAATAVPFPFFEMTQLVMGGRYFERVDAIWIVQWVTSTAGQLTFGMMFGSLLLREAFRLPDCRGAVLPLASAVLATAIFPSNQATAIALETFFLRRWGFLITLVLPLTVALLAGLRRGRGAGA